MGVLLWLLAQATEPEAPLANLHGVVVDAIRNCGQRDGEIIVCPRDRGFAEGQRIRKITKPRPPSSDAGVKVQVTTAPAPPKTEW